MLGIHKNLNKDTKILNTKKNYFTKFPGYKINKLKDNCISTCKLTLNLNMKIFSMTNNCSKEK